MKSELIASTKSVLVADKKNPDVKREMVMVITVSGATVWVPKAQFETNAEQISYKELKEGDSFTNTKTGETGKRTKDGNEFVGCGKQIVQKYDSKSILDHLISKGITPTFSLS